MKLKYGLWVLILLSELNIFAQTRSLTLPTDTTDTWQVSLITCGPGVEVYNQFGHTAIRMKNVTRDIDLIYATLTLFIIMVFSVSTLLILPFVLLWDKPIIFWVSKHIKTL